MTKLRYYGNVLQQCDDGYHWHSVPTVEVEQARPVTKWECEVVFHHIPGSQPAFAHSVTRGHAALNYECARTLLEFDDKGRVWFADEDAKELAAGLKAIVDHKLPGNSGWRILLRAAERLAGPE